MLSGSFCYGHLYQKAASSNGVLEGGGGGTQGLDGGINNMINHIKYSVTDKNVRILSQIKR